VSRLPGATKTVFLTRGFAGTTVDEITKLAGVSRSTFYAVDAGIATITFNRPLGAAVTP
jgi:hypothetical protein